jgi:Transcriptional regulator
MDLRKLEYFLTVAKEGQITKAAQVLYMSQPPLSYQLKALEQELGVQLLEKSGRNIRLTEQGRLLYERAPVILEMVKNIIEDLHEISSGAAEVLTIGNASPWGFAILPEQIRLINECLPDTRFRLWQGDTHQIMELLNNEMIEIGFVTLPTSNTVYESKAMDIEPLCAFFSTKCDYGRKANCIKLKELAESPLILTHNYTYDLLSVYYRRIGLKPKLVSHNDTLSMLDWASVEPWIIIGPKSVFDLNPRPNIKYKPIIAPPVEIISYIVWRKNHPLSKAAKTFVNMLMENFSPITKACNEEVYRIIGDPNRLQRRAFAGGRFSSATQSSPKQYSG